jgi:hypothetical protein
VVLRTLPQRVATLAVVLGVLALSSSSLAQRASTDSALARAREALDAAQSERTLPADSTVLLVEARPAFAETKASFPADAAAVVVEVFGPRRVRLCEACMNPRVIQDAGGVRYDTGEINLADLVALDAAARGSSPPARMAIWLQETPSGVALRVVDLKDGSLLLARHLDAGLATLQRSARQVSVTEDMHRRLRGDSLTHVHWNLGLFPGQHFGFDVLDQFGPTRQDLAGLTISFVNPVGGIGASYEHIFPEALNLAVGGKLIVGIPGVIAQAVGSQTGVDPALTSFIGGPLTIMGTAQLPIFDTNYAVFAFAGLHLPAFVPTAGVGISLLNLRILPFLP